MKKRILIIFYCLFFPVFLVTGFSSWVIMGEKNMIVGQNSVQVSSSVAYIINSNNEKTHEYTNVNAAIIAANKLGTATVVIKPGTNAIITHDCTIDEGVTLSIPYSLSEDGVTPNVYSNNGSGVGYSTNCTNTLYIDDNVQVVNNGIINIGGIISGGSGGGASCGQTSGDFGKIEMGENSIIISSKEINCYGYIVEKTDDNGSLIHSISGKVTIPFILKDFRGGNQTSSLVFGGCEPFNQFEIRNIQSEIKFAYGAEMYGLGNVSANKKVNEASVLLIGTTNKSFLQLALSSCYISIKCSKDGEKMNFALYGGGGINTISLNIGVELDTKSVYLPINYRMSLSLNALDEQKSKNEYAEYNASSQKIKLLTGSKLVVDEHSKFTSTNMIVYSHFDYDNSNYKTASALAGTKYPDKKAAEFVVYGKYICNGKFGGRIIKGSSASVTASGDLTIYEPLEPGTLGMGAVKEHIIETTNIVSISDYNNLNEIIVYIVTEDDWDSPKYNLLGKTYASNIIKYTSNTSVTLTLEDNASKATFNGTDYTSGESVTLGEENVFVVVGTAPSSGDSGGGGGCLLPGTMITMLDGTKKPVEQVQPGDELKVFNHYTGEYDVSPVVFNDSEPRQDVNVINLEFSNGSNIGVVYEHGFFDLDLMKYVYIDEYNYNDYVGHRFYSDGNNIVTLNRAYITTEYTEVYSPVTAYHLNYFTEDILSMPGGIEGLFNIFEYDDDLKYNEELMKQDIEKYGLYTYDDFKDYCSYEFYQAFPAEYLKVAVGKGYIAFDEIIYLINRYKNKV